MEQIEPLPQVIAYSHLLHQVEVHFAQAEKGHDYAHTMRVAHLAVSIGRTEKADEDLLFLAAVLHDVADHKFGSQPLHEVATPWLNHYKLPPSRIQEIFQLANSVSFSGNGGTNSTPWIELQCLRDADRLEAIGALGIARCFHYGGYKNRELFNPSIPFGSAEKPTTPSLNHFFEKLLGLRNGMYTAAGKALAEPRHLLLLQYVHSFLEEWFHPHPVPSNWLDALDKYQ